MIFFLNKLANFICIIELHFLLPFCGEFMNNLLLFRYSLLLIVIEDALMQGSHSLTVFLHSM